MNKITSNARPDAPGRQLSALLLSCCLTTALAGAVARADDLPAKLPPFLSQGVGPNLVITIDDSQSMIRAYFGENRWINTDWRAGVRWLACPEANPLYYQPDTEYKAALDADGVPLPVEDSLDSVLAFPFRGKPECPGIIVDLANDFRPVADAYAGPEKGCSSFPVQTFPRGFPREQPPYWYKFDPNAGYYDADDADDSFDYQPCSTDTDPADADHQPNCKRCGTEHPKPNPMTPDPCFRFELVEDQHNFLIWYKFYRTRLLTTKTVLTHVLQDLHDGVRVTYQGLYGEGDTTGLGFSPGTDDFDWLVDNFRPYGESRADVFDWLFGLSLPSEDTTYLVAAHIRAGEFVRQGIALADDIDEHLKVPNPGATDPVGNMCGAKCRKNFHLLMADGAWTDWWAPPKCVLFACFAGREITGTEDGDWIKINQDNNGALELPTTEDSPFGDIDYTPRGPYKDPGTAMLADAAFYYWAKDLRPDVDNEVPVSIPDPHPGKDTFDKVNFWNPNNDPADWQHLTLFTVLYGMEGGIRIPDGEDAAYDPEDCADPEAATAYARRDGNFLCPYGTWEVESDGVVTTKDVATEGFPSCREEPYVAPEDDETPDDLQQIPCEEAFSYSGQRGMPAAAKVDDLYHAALNARGRLYEASAPKALIESFSDVLSTVSAAAEDKSANAPVAISAGRLSGDSRIYQALSSSEDWSGEIRVLRVSTGAGDPSSPCPDKRRGKFCENPDTDPPYQSTRAEGSFPPHGQRVVFTMADGKPERFDEDLFGKLSQRQKEGLTGTSSPTEALADAYISWLRGNDKTSTAGIPEADVPQFRERETLLGDILGSGPLVVGPPRQLFTDPDYLDFKRDDAHQDRDTMVYVGANDGMLHAFNADDSAESVPRPLREAFAYVPGAVYDNLADLADPGYANRFADKEPFVDGALSYSDAKFADSRGESGWRSVLVGALGRGAQGIYALDVTDTSPAHPNDLVLWEFTDASGDDADDGKLDGRDMGYNLAKPAIVRIDDNLSDKTEPTWVVLVGNGYGSTDATGEKPSGACTDDDDPVKTNCTVSQTGNAVLYVLNLGGSDETRILARMDTGVGMDEDPTGAGRTNGLAEVSTLDENSDLIADRAYAGDHFGNLWRFDLTDTNKPPTRLFRARDPYGAPQPITSRIAFTRHPNGGYMLFFGTGRWINADDKLDDSVQTFYGIWDDDGLVHPGPGGDFSEPTRADLIWHEFLFVNNPIKVEGRDDDGLGTGVIVSEGRISSTDAAPKSTPAGAIRGWMIDLVTKDEDDDLIYAGERVVVAPQVRQGRVVFVSMIPGDCCSAGGSSWINALDALDGSRLDFTPFDFNMDGKFDTHDLLDVDGDPTTQGVVGSSIRVYNPNETGIYSAPSTLDMGGGEVMSIVSDSEGDLIQLEEWGAFGWRTWLQLQ